MKKKIFIAPIYGIELTKSVNNEFQIIRTILITKEKLRRNRKKFGIPEQVSKLPKFDRENFFDISGTFAVVQHNDTENYSTLADKSLKIIQRELSILSLSILQYKKRGETSIPTVMNPSVIPTNRYAITNINIDTLSGTLKLGGLQGRFLPLILNDEWKSHQRKNFFFNLINFIRKENKRIRVNKNWIEEIIKASVLIGKSINSNDLEDSFLWNMIALEILLTNSDDSKFLDILPKRIEAFFGWYTNWKTDEFEDKIKEIYGKRCSLVHRAKGENITTEDLLFTDSLLFNLLLNITSFPKLFRTQKSLINFSRRLEAQKILGIKRKPIGLKFVKVSSDNDDVKKFFGK
jgi:Holliday junction resolvase